MRVETYTVTCAVHIVMVHNFGPMKCRPNGKSPININIEKLLKQ